MAYAVNDGVRIHYEIVGNGPPLILQHGATHSIEEWHHYGYVTPLSTRYRLIMVDARGHGQSDKPHEPSAYAHSIYVNDIVAVLDAAGVERAHYWGYSMGGWIGLGFITQAPTRLMKAVIGGAHPYERKLPPGKLDGSDPLHYAREYYRRSGADFDSTPVERQKRFLAGDTMAWAAALHDRASIEALMPTVAAPCLMYAGEEDAVSAPAKKGAALMPNCRFVAVPGDHEPAFWNSAAILPHVTAFLG